MPEKQTIALTPLLVLTVLASAGAAIGGVALLVNILERQQESRDPFFRVVEISDEVEDPAVWGENFPLQYDGYLRTVDQIRTRYGGSEAMPRTPTAADPRSIVSQSPVRPWSWATRYDWRPLSRCS